jgi:MFS family permease
MSSDAAAHDAAAGAARRWGAFSYAAYRQYWFASVARVFGLQFRIVGSGWLVVSVLHKSPIWLGIVELCVALPSIVFSVPAGELADRVDNKRLLVLSQGASTVCHFGLATLIVTGYVNVWLVIGWALLSGSLTALGNPALQAILPRLIEMRAMASAVAFNSAIWNSMRIIGPAIAGVLIALIGTGEAFFVTAAGFVASTIVLARLRLRPLDASAEAGAPAHARHADRGMMSGLRYIFGNRLFLAVMGLSFFSSVFGMSYEVLMPIFAADILKVGSQGFGFMGACSGIGALLGTLSIVRIGAGRWRGQVMIGAATIYGLIVAAFAASTFLPASLVLLFCAGFVSSVYLNVGMTTLQVMVPNELRGRVMGVWSMTWFLTSVGGFIAGAGAELIGTRLMVAIGALSVTAFAVGLYAVSAELRAMPRVEGGRIIPVEPAEAPAGG